MIFVTFELFVYHDNFSAGMIRLRKFVAGKLNKNAQLGPQNPWTPSTTYRSGVEDKVAFAGSHIQ